MSLQPISGIEGLSGALHEVGSDFSDTPPVGTVVKFDVVMEEMPFESQNNPKGTIVRRPFVYIYKTMNLGNSSLRRRIRDAVELDETTGKWVIRRLAPGMEASDGGFRSDIRRYPEAWNAFFRGTTLEDLGTPLLMLFKADLSRVERYRAVHINTIERLASLSEADFEQLGAGSRSDSERARKYLAFAKEAADGNRVNALMEQKDQEISTLRTQIQDLTEKITRLLDKELNEEGTSKPAGKAGRSARQSEES